MPPQPEYKPTFFDRHGPDAGTYVRAIGAGVIAFLMTFGVTSARGNPWRAFFISLGAGLLTGGSGIIVGSLAAGLTSRFVFGGGTTPYVPQYSYQDSLIQQGKLDEALASFEALIAEHPQAADVRFRAAELYVKNEHSLNRAAELFREVQRIPGVATGDDV